MTTALTLTLVADTRALPMVGIEDILKLRSGESFYTPFTMPINYFHTKRIKEIRG